MRKKVFDGVRGCGQSFPVILSKGPKGDTLSVCVQPPAKEGPSDVRTVSCEPIPYLLKAKDKGQTKDTLISVAAH